MFKALLTTTVLSLVGATEENGYQAQAAPGAYHPYGQQPAAAYHPYQGPQGGYYRKTFPPAHPLIDAKFYQGVLIGFQQCVEHKCDKLSHDYSTTASDSVKAVGAYTACVTSCTASEMMRVISDFKALVGKLFDIGSAHLNEAHRYLAGKGDYDVLESNTRIEDSCCLPDEYFVAWDELLFGAEIKFHADEDSEYKLRMITVKSYFDYCLQDPATSKHYLDRFSINCDKNWAKYFRSMQQNIGHLVLAPKCKNLAPEGACTKDRDSNPQAEEFGEDMCVAYECTQKGIKRRLDHAILKYPVKAFNYEASCVDDKDANSEVVVKYRRVPRHALTYYPLLSGLPSAFTNSPSTDPETGITADKCTYDLGLFAEGGEDGRLEQAVAPTFSNIHALYSCPSSGRFEYCNVKQWVNWLQEQLFDFGGCPIVDMADTDAPADSPYAYYTLACLFRVVSLKCDCMEAVLNCYESEYEFSSELGKTLGKAASVLCGFILCQKPKVYSLLGGEQAISRANIMRHVLMQASVLSPEVTAFPPATFAFLSFGLGMVCVFVLTKAGKKAKRAVGVDDGYRNLI